MAERSRAVVAALVAALLTVLASCSWGPDEPGLFTTPAPPSDLPSGPSSVEPPQLRPPEPTDPRLPVVGESVWTTAEGNAVTVRLAVHAVRRTPGATVLDWSVTPLADRGRRPGEPLPAATDLALDRDLPGQQNLALLDAPSAVAHRPLARVAPRLLSRCLCTPLFAALPALRLGETRLLQIGFPALPPTTTRVDVVLPDLAVVPGVPVTPPGEAPVAGVPTDLARPVDRPGPATRTQRYRLPHGDRQAVSVDRVVASARTTAVEWTFASVGRQATRTRPVPPLSRPAPAGVRLATAVPASGPRLRLPGASAPSAGVRWATTGLGGPPAYECLCSGLGLWSRGLRDASSPARLTTQVGPLPAGTDHVDVLLPGLEPFTDVPVTWVEDAPALLTVPATATWTYVRGAPPGWATSAWPTPVPALEQDGTYASRPGRLVAALPSPDR